MKILIERYKCPSWNEFNRSQMHWTERGVRRDELAELVHGCIFSQYSRAAFKRRVLEMKKPADVRIEAFFKSAQRRDPDNLYVKPILDGIVKAGILPDDNGEFINSVTLMARVKAGEDKIIIYINE